MVGTAPSSAASAAPSWWNAANAVTLLRIVLVPAFVVLLAWDRGTSFGTRLAAVALFVVAAASDRLDGWLARRSGLVTDVGKILDPIADKLLMGGALVTLSALGELPWWVTVVILVREVGITVMRLAMLRYVVMPASRGGKLKTLLQSVAIGLFLLPWAREAGPVRVVAWVVMAAALAVTVVTGFDYVRSALRVRRDAGAVAVAPASPGMRGSAGPSGARGSSGPAGSPAPSTGEG